MFKRNVYVMLSGALLLSLAIFSFPVNTYAEKETNSPSGTTLDNLLTAHSAEINAYVRYMAFAQKAGEEGYGEAASLFRAIARAKQIRSEHLAALIKKLGGTVKIGTETFVVRSTKENLGSALRSESYKKDVMYPGFLKQAKKEKVESTVKTFNGADKVEGVYIQLCTKALGDLDSGKSLKKDYFVCSVCGNVMEKLPGICPICGAPKEKFITVN